ncbi:phosphatase 2c domain containing protein [Zalerion maritima]|uniref:Phosphatase 2c domain containing protein n=1 Tax=Zalerion maritima TaxID=339359 RepID=A0AAD5RJ32_9PEZI|nr:phosphatase 2c domain containing protein [Zalerion maritima]
MTTSNLLLLQKHSSTNALARVSQKYACTIAITPNPYGGSAPRTASSPLRRHAASIISRGHRYSSSRSVATKPRWQLANPPPRAPRSLSQYYSERGFQTYFITHLPSSSVHPDSSGPPSGPHHKLPRSASMPHETSPDSSPAASPPNMLNRNLTVVRIPLRSAKHHFGTTVSRGTRVYNEDTNQAGTITVPAFAKRAPISLVRSKNAMQRSGQGMTADSAFGDPQIFYFAVFDGHGGTECSEFLRDELHGYIEEAAHEFKLGSSLRSRKRQMQLLEESQRLEDDRKRRKEEMGRERVARQAGKQGDGENEGAVEEEENKTSEIMSGPSEGTGRASLANVEMKSAEEVEKSAEIPTTNDEGAIQEVPNAPAISGSDPIPAKVDDLPNAILLERSLIEEYRKTIGGYFRRFKPQYFDLTSSPDEPEGICVPVTVESVLTYAFLRADLDFVTAQARKPDPDDPYVSDFPLNNDEILGSPNHRPPSGHTIGGPTRFKGGSTASVVLVSTPTPAPFWHPAAHASIMVAHVGDTRVLLCETATGLPKPLTSDHHPSSPMESRRLTRYAESLVTDSFGDQRIGGSLANSRAFGDMGHKRIGVSAEPEITRVDMGPAEYSFVVLCSDGVSGTLSDQEIVDIVKENKTPEAGSRAVVEYATEISKDGDNATCQVVRLGGWERRSEGGLGSLGTKEIRDMRKAEALDPRRRRS